MVSVWDPSILGDDSLNSAEHKRHFKLIHPFDWIGFEHLHKHRRMHVEWCQCHKVVEALLILMILIN